MWLNVKVTNHLLAIVCHLTNGQSQLIIERIGLIKAKIGKANVIPLRPQDGNMSGQRISLPIYAGLMLITSMFLACNSSTLVDMSENLANEVWRMDDTLESQFQISDTSRFHTIHLQTRLTGDFPFSNLYVKLIIENPSGLRTETLHGFEISTKSGKWLGSGLGDLHAYSLPLEKAFIAKIPGTYKIMVVQNMRRDELFGCHDRGLRVELGEDIF